MSAPVNVSERVNKVLHDLLGVDVEKIAYTSRLRQDLGADSLDEVEIVMALEEEFGIEIPDDEADKHIGTAGDLAALVASKL